MTILAISHKG